MHTPIPLRRLAAALAFAGLAGPAAAQYSTPMRDVENPDRAPFTMSANGGPSSPYINGFVQFATPLGFRYFIDQASLVCTSASSTDEITLVQLSTLQKTGANFLQSSSITPFIMTRVGPAPFGGWYWTGTAQLRAYSDPNVFDTNGGRSILYNIFHTEASSTTSCSGTIVGHTLPLAQ